MDAFLDGANECVAFFTDLRDAKLDVHFELDEKRGYLRVVGTREDMLNFLLPYYEMFESLEEALEVEGEDFDIEGLLSECGERKVAE
jgi:hypothetical protein